MKIHSVLISNYKGINLSINLSDGINVITGENGSGKSNILEAMRFALGEDISFKSNAVTNKRNFAIIKVILANKSLLLDKYSILKKLYRSGNVKTFFSDDLPENIDCLLLDYDSHCFMNQEKLQEFINELKEKSKDTQIIIVSQSKEIIDLADCVFKTQRVRDGYTVTTQNKAVA
jgi:chromosome segregation ATPase